MLTLRDQNTGQGICVTWGQKSKHMHQSMPCDYALDVERLQQYSVKYCVDLYNLQLTSDVRNILISPHIVIRALDYNGSTIPRLVNRRSGWWMVGRAVKFLGVVSGWNIIA